MAPCFAGACKVIQYILWERCSIITSRQEQHALRNDVCFAPFFTSVYADGHDFLLLRWLRSDRFGVLQEDVQIGQTVAQSI